MALSRAADHSVLWLVLAAAGASFGGRRGRRAARQGLLAVAFSSAVVNGPLKLIVGRRRPAVHRRLRRTPRTSSFPSGHAASAFAFAVAATRELPWAGPVLVPLAACVAYSRVYVGVHYPSDVLAGAAFGTAAGAAARPAARALGIWSDEEGRHGASPPISEAVLVLSPHAGNSGGLERARRALARRGIEVAVELDIESVASLPELLATAAGQPRLVIAAGGDGTVGSVAGYLAGTANVLGVLPLGTGNDFARSLGIPIDARRAAEQLAGGVISSVDLGRLERAGEPPAHFVHAATVGVGVDFAKMATRASVRARLGRLAYLAASLYALGERTSFRCELRHDDVIEELSVLQLSVISAPVVGGSLGLSLRDPVPDDHTLGVLAVEDVSAWRMLRAGVFLLLGHRRTVAGVRAMHVSGLDVATRQPLGLVLDGELAGTVPGRFGVAVGALRVVVPRPS